MHTRENYILEKEGFKFDIILMNLQKGGRRNDCFP